MATRPRAQLIVEPTNAEKLFAAVTKVLETNLGFADERANAQAAFDEVKGSINNRRSQLFVSCAKVSVQLDVDAEVIDTVVKAAVEAFVANHKLDKNSQNTFASDIKKAMHPSVREHVAECFDVAHKVWEQEIDEVKATHKREAQLAGKLMTALKEGHALPTVNEVIAAAEQAVADRPHDPDIAAKALRGLVDRLTTMHAEFPCIEIEAMIKFCTKLSAKTLEAARAKAGKSPVKAAVAPVAVAPVAVAAKVRNAPPPVTSVDDAILRTLNI